MSKLKKIWYFIWKDNSALSWIVNIILAFLIVKFLLYPGLGLLLGTKLPVVAVVSHSMEHKIVERPSSVLDMCGEQFSKKQKIDFDEYWEICGKWYEKNAKITKNEFNKFIFKNGFNKGDLIVLFKKDNIKVGDVIVYNGNEVYPIIHRVININNNLIYTKGDHNDLPDMPIKEDRIIGKAVLRIPLLGWVKVGFVEILRLTHILDLINLK